jgi:epoxide hydrolase 4
VPGGRLEILRAIPDDPQPLLAEPEIRQRSCSNLNTHCEADTTRRLAPWRGYLRGPPRERCMRFPLEHQEIPTNGIRLHVVQTGPVTGPLVLLLHGFPEFWYGWRYQLPSLAAIGYRIWAPDQRGYNLSDKPPGIAAYRLEVLAADVLGLLDATGQEKASIVGHDWGGVVGWWLASHAPHRLERMVVINAPHGAVMRQHLRRHPAQWLKSAYIGFFQLPWIPELVSRMGHWRLLVRALQQSSRPGTFTTADLEHYRQAWAHPQGYHAMLNWYRAAVRKPPSFPVHRPITVPTLLIWGALDVFLSREMAQSSIALCQGGQLAMLEEGTHWVHHEEAARVNALIDTFLRGGQAS